MKHIRTEDRVIEDKNVTIVTFADKKLFNSSQIEQLGEELFGLTSNKRNIVLDFSNLDYVSSVAFGKFIILYRMLRESRNKLVFCCVAPEILDVIRIMRLDKFIKCASDVKIALASI